ncbi:unnamed protein product, partial [Meganyctiphanes norvegica]
YSIDARSGPFHSATHWSDLGARAYFNLNAFPPGLVIHGVNRDDEGDYRCRVDFRLKPSRNARIRLNVVVPTSSVTISINNDTVSGIIGPFPVGRALDLTCTASGGHPLPTITWWNEGLLVDSFSEVVTEEATYNTLTLHHMRHSDLYRKFTCQAVNSNLTMPKAETVTLDLIFPLEEVSILERPGAMAEGQNYSILCEAKGSRPPAVITWWLDEIELTDTQQEVLFEASITHSILNLKPDKSDDGAILSCRAYNPLKNDTIIEDNTNVTVHYPPDVTLQLAEDCSIISIQENDSIAFECLTEAKPNAYSTTWFINDKQVEPNLSSGILIQNHTLQLHKVSRDSSGLYTCKAANTQGNTTSNAININVKYAPVCGLHKKYVYYGGQKEAFNITCNVEAHPAPTLFKWALNTSLGINYIAETRFLNGHSQSTILYTTHSPEDFGSLLCWAENEVGQQIDPCRFTVAASVVPEPVHNCTFGHSPTVIGGVMVDCQVGWGGGLDQTYSVEVTLDEQVLAKLVDHKDAHFSITGLKPGSKYKLSVVSHNAKGSSVPNIINMDMPVGLAEKHTSSEHGESNDILFASPILGMLVGIAGAIIICLTILVAIHLWNDVKRCKHHSNRRDYDKDDMEVRSFDGGSLISQEISGSDIIILKADQHSSKENEHIYQFIRAQDNVYVEPRTLITKNLVGTLERKDRMAIIISKSPRSSMGGHQSPIHSIGNPHIYNTLTSSCQSHRNSVSSSSSSPPPGRGSPDRESTGRYSPASSVSSNPRISSLFASRRGSSSTIIHQPDCYMPNTAGDSITTPLVMPSNEITL